MLFFCALPLLSYLGQYMYGAYMLCASEPCNGAFHALSCKKCKARGVVQLCSCCCDSVNALVWCWRPAGRMPPARDVTRTQASS